MQEECHAHSNAHGHAHLTPQTPNTIQMNDTHKLQKIVTFTLMPTNLKKS